MTRSHIVACRSLPRGPGSDSAGWLVASLDGKGGASITMEGVGSASAVHHANQIAFTNGYPADLTITNRTLDQVVDDPHAYLGALLCPEGGAAPKDIWVSMHVLSKSAGNRFHESEIGAAWRFKHAWPPMPTALDNRPLVDEQMIRHDWKAADRFVSIQDRQIEEAEREDRNAKIIAAMQTDKVAHVRNFGPSSPYFDELYGKMPPAEWDRLWQGWQREDLDRLRTADENGPVHGHATGQDAG